MAHKLEDGKIITGLMSIVLQKIEAGSLNKKFVTESDIYETCLIDKIKEGYLKEEAEKQIKETFEGDYVSSKKTGFIVKQKIYDITKSGRDAVKETLYKFPLNEYNLSTLQKYLDRE